MWGGAAQVSAVEFQNHKLENPQALRSRELLELQLMRDKLMIHDTPDASWCWLRGHGMERDKGCFQVRN